MDENRLFYGDNFEVLRQHIAGESVDLVYLDPPFNSNADYNVLFAEQDGSRSASQIKAFGDTWRWDQAAAKAFHEVVTSGHTRVSLAMQAFRTFLGENDVLAYLAMMAPRLVELHRVLKTTGSIYLHCDPTSSHYLKILMDGVFGVQNFRSEVIWKRTPAHGSAKKWGNVHDSILFYSKTGNYAWSDSFLNYQEKHIIDKYSNHDDRGRFMADNLTGAGLRTGDSGKPWRGFDPSTLGRHWAVSKAAVSLVAKDDRARTTQEKLDLLDANDSIYWPTKEGGFPRFKRYLGKGMVIQDVVVDIPPINSQAQERLGYPTQKPVALLERIIKASSNEGDTILDPFCGCGTAVAVSQRLNRRWIGIDVTHLAVTLIKSRLRDSYGEAVFESFRVVGEPVSLPDAEALAASDPYQFQWWSMGLVGARPVEQKKGADKGIDGRIFFHDDMDSGKTKQVILSVKAGNVGVPFVRDLRGVIDREKAAIGALITMKEPTGPMRAESAGAGYYESPWGTKHPRLQIITVADLLQGKKIDMPPSGDLRTFKKAPKAKKRDRPVDSALLFAGFIGEDEQPVTDGTQSALDPGECFGEVDLD